jgi:hypothetical protein
MLLSCVALGACLVHAPVLHAARTEPASEARDRRAAAKAAFFEGRDAAARGDYDAALEGFERALALEPSPGIHYNIAVCHHRLMLEVTEGSEAYETSRRRAIEAYDRYLEAAPDADDREAVQELIRSLGGRSTESSRWTIERLEPDPSPELRGPEPDPPEPDPPEVQLPEPPPRVEPKPPARATTDWRPRGRVGAGFVLGLTNMRELARTDEVATLPSLGLTLRGGAFLGPRDRINLGGEVALAGQPSRTDTRHRLATGHLGVTIDYGHPVGERRRLEIGGGGLVGIAGQSLHHRGASQVSCPTTSRTQGDRVVGQRGGLLLGGRFTLAALLGRRRNHELALRITPGLGLYGAGQRGSHTVTGESCDEGPTPFEELGMNGPALVVMVDLGYAPRF